MSSRERLLLFTALAVGAIARVAPVLGAAAAVGDGGLFHAMVDDVRTAGLTVPSTTSYNGLEIPFVYPPLALLAAAAIGEAIDVPTLAVVTWMPPVIGVATLVAFAWTARRVLPATSALIATFAYALMPRAYDWVIGGGGLTRGLGLLFVLLAIGIAAPSRGPGRWRPIAAGALLGLAVVTHPQAAVFGVLACVVISARRPLRHWLTELLVAGGVALAIATPWLAGVGTTHGLDALASAAHRFQPATGLIRLLSFEFTGAPFMDLFAVIGVVGLGLAMANRQWRIPLVLLGTYLLGAGGGEFLAAPTWALLGGIGGAGLVRLLVSSAAPRPLPLSARVAGGLLLLFLALVGSFGSVADRSSKLQAISGDHLAAMTWVADHLPTTTRFLIPTTEVWGDDELSEWFPAIAHRGSLGTVQGSEWLGRAGFVVQLSAHSALLACAGDTASCYTQIDPDAAIFVPKGRLAGPFSPADCCRALRATLEDAGYDILYDGAGATIAQRRP